MEEDDTWEDETSATSVTNTESEVQSQPRKIATAKQKDKREKKKRKKKKRKKKVLEDEEKVEKKKKDPGSTSLLDASLTMGPHASVHNEKSGLQDKEEHESHTKSDEASDCDHHKSLPYVQGAVWKKCYNTNISAHAQPWNIPCGLRRRMETHGRNASSPELGYRSTHSPYSTNHRLSQTANVNETDDSFLSLWLPEDTFSLLVIGEHPLTIGIALAVMTVQLIFVFILLADLIQRNTEDDYTPRNLLSIPAAVTRPVAISQFIALLVTLVSVDNMTWALLVHWQNGHFQEPARIGYHQWLTFGPRYHAEHEEKKDEEQKPRKTGMDEESALLLSSQNVNVARLPVALAEEDANPLVSRWFRFTWYASNGLRCLEGCSSFVATFLLIITSETVVDVLLTFSAIHFVSYLDNVVFWLTRVGYFGRTVQTEALHPMCCSANFTTIPALMRPMKYQQVGDDAIKTNDPDNTQSSMDSKKSKTKTGTTMTTLRIFLRGIVMRIALAVIAVIGWSTVLAKQNSGDYLVSHLYVQMGDTTNLKLGTYSGIYVRSKHRSPDTKRFSYHSRNIHGEHRGELLYCEPLQAWVFRDSSITRNSDRPCRWWLKSTETTSFDVLSTALSQWYLDESFNIKTPVDWMFLTAYSPRHKPHNTYCEVSSNSSRYGLNCEFTDPCPILTVNQNTNPFGQGVRWFPSEFRLVPNLEIYHRPVYYGQVQEDFMDVIFFTGRRWVMVSTQLPSMTGIGNDTVAQRLATIGLTSDFEVPSLPWNQTMNVHYISEPVDVTAHNDNRYHVTPTQLQWSPATARSRLLSSFQVDGSRKESGTRLVCAECSVFGEDANEEDQQVQEGQCLFNGRCQVASKTCLCQYGSRGQICEVPPTGNGLCDLNFNQAAYDYDGGDCCLSTCNADGEFLCGMSRNGELDIKNVACQVERGLAGWNLQSELLSPSFNGQLYLSSLASNWRGSVVVTTKGDQNERDHIVLHRTSGSHWVTEVHPVKRSSSLISFHRLRDGPSNPHVFGWEVQMAEILPNAVANNNNRVPVHVGIMSMRRQGGRSQVSYTRELDIFYCSFRSHCYHPSIYFDSNFNNVSRPPIEDFLPPPHIENTTKESQGIAAKDFRRSIFLSRDGLYMVVANGYSFTIQEWNFAGYSPHSSGFWGPSFGTKRLGLDSNDLGACILSIATSDGMGNDNQEIVIAVGLVRMMPPYVREKIPMGYSSDFSGTNPKNHGMYPLHVVVYRWIKGMEPTPMGTPIKSHEHLDLDSDNNSFIPKDSVQISTNGRVLSILSFFQSEDEGVATGRDEHGKSGPGEIFEIREEKNNTYKKAAIIMIKVYEWDDVNDDWKLRQMFPLPGPKSYILTVSHSLSWDGSVVAITESNPVYRMTIYRWNTDAHEYFQQMKEEKAGQPLSRWEQAHQTASLSGDGSSLFVASPFASTVLTYRDDYATACRGNETHPQLLHIALQTRYMEGTQWSVIKRSTNTTIRRNGPQVFLEDKNLRFSKKMEFEANLNFPSFAYQECFAVMECSTMGLTVKTVPSEVHHWQLGDQYLAIFNGKNLTGGEFNKVISVHDADCELVIEIQVFNNSEI